MTTRICGAHAFRLASGQAGKIPPAKAGASQNLIRTPKRETAARFIRVLEFWRVQTNYTSRPHDQRLARSSRRQIHFSSLRNARSACRRPQRNHALFRRGRLPQHARLLFEYGSEGRYSGRPRPHRRRWPRRVAQTAPHAGCRKFGHDDAPARRDSGRTGISIDPRRRHLLAPPADATCDGSAHANGRANSGPRRRLRSSED